MDFDERVLDKNILERGDLVVPSIPNLCTASHSPCPDNMVIEDNPFVF